MSRAKSSKPVAAKRGIKMQRIGATWWGKRWIETVERLSREYLNRLGRGRAYARSGRVHNLTIAPGRVHAQVTGPDDEIYDVSLRVAVLPSASWQKVIAAMSKQAVFSAELLSGRMPTNIDEAFRAAGHSLFLGKQRELEADCTCADWANPCIHVAAAHYVLSEAFDKDPFLLFELRGRTRAQLLGALRAARTGRDTELDHIVVDSDARVAKDHGAARAGIVEHGIAGHVIVGQAIPPFEPGDFERCPAPPPVFAFRIEAPASSGALLKQLGPPPSWNNDDVPFETLIKLYRAASRRACELALPEAADSPRRGRATR